MNGMDYLVPLQTLTPAPPTTRNGPTSHADALELETARTGFTNSFLNLIELLQIFDVPTTHAYVLQGGASASSSIGLLGKGGQYAVDRSYDNQRYTDIAEGRKAETVVVHKRMLRSNEDQGTSLLSESNRLHSFVREIMALGLMRTHPNVVDLLGVSWETGGAHDISPILVLEYATHQSLRHFLLSNDEKPKTMALKRKLCQDVGIGLNAVHDAGLIWGDCKPDNVLIFQEPSDPTSVRAKLSDFGCSISRDSSEMRLVGQSIPWNAPENLHIACSFEDLVKADIYSYGMVVWAILLDGQQFRRDHLFEETRSTKEATSADVELLKFNNELLNAAVRSTQAYLRTLNEMEGPLASEKDVEHFTAVLVNTMNSDVEQRSLRIDVQPGVEAKIKSDKASFLDTSPANSINIQNLYRAYGPSTGLDQVAAAIPRRLLDHAARTNSSAAYFSASICFAIGLGVTLDISKSAELMIRAASLGSYSAQGLSATMTTLAATHGHLVADSLIKDDDENDDLIHFDDLVLDDLPVPIQSRFGPSEDEPMKSLCIAAAAGSRYAAEELRQRDPEVYRVAKESLRNDFEGVGFHNCPTQEQCTRAQSKRRYQTNASLTTRGDTSLHLAALKGNISEVQMILDSESADIDCCNNDGETAFLCAMRSGHSDVAAVLVKAGADIRARDSRGLTALHWLISIEEAPSDQLWELLRKLDPNIISTTAVEYSDHYGSKFEPGSALDWAVDARNLIAIKLLCQIHADPLTELEHRPSAFHRSCIRHDVQVMTVLLQDGSIREKDVSRLDQKGQSAVSYILQQQDVFDRLLIGAHSPNDFKDVLRILTHRNADLEFVNRSGESALYCAVRHQDELASKAIIEIHTGVIPELLIRSRSSWNRWSSLRRAVYAGNAAIFKTLLSYFEEKGWPFLDESADGLSVLHECAFASPEAGVACARTILSKSRARRTKRRRKQDYRRLLKVRLSERADRGRLSVFQLAVLLQKFELADLFIRKGANPIAGVDRIRFLGYLIQYQKHDLLVTSTFLDPVVDDPIVAALRQFPHPADIQPSIEYLLSREQIWWSYREPDDLEEYSHLWRVPGLERLCRWFADRNWWTTSGSFQRMFDQNEQHDPLIGRRPGFTQAWDVAINADSPTNSAREIARYGTEGLWDMNTAGCGLRSRHAGEYGSFLISYRNDSQKESSYGHSYVTALELAFDTVLECQYQEQAENVLFALLEMFKGPEYCNFPYAQYFPVAGRSSSKYLRRRETLLHRAIRARKPAIVERLLTAGADCEIANIQWQSPLHLARILARGDNPHLAKQHGTFWQRLDPAKPIITYGHTSGSDDCDKILALLEKKLASSRREVWPPIRALKEVRWPWDEYEVDDVGIKFLLFYISIFLVILFFFYIIKGFSSVVLGIFGVLIEVVANMADVSADMSNCYLESRRNGSDPLTMCATIWMKGFDEFGQGLFNYSSGMISVLDECYDESVPVNRSLNPIFGKLPGCFDENYSWLEDPKAGKLTNIWYATRAALIEEKSNCKCTWLGRPYRSEKKGNVHAGNIKN